MSLPTTLGLGRAIDQARHAFMRMSYTAQAAAVLFGDTRLGSLHRGKRRQTCLRYPLLYSGYHTRPRRPTAHTCAIGPPRTLVRYSCDSAYTVDMQRLLPPPAIHPALARGEGPAIVRIVRIAAPEDRTAPPNLATATEAMVAI